MGQRLSCATTSRQIGTQSLRLTERMDLYLGLVMTLMFLAGCVLIILSVRERSEERKRRRGWTAAKPRAPAESKPL